MVYPVQEYIGEISLLATCEKLDRREEQVKSATTVIESCLVHACRLK